jgi:hypothetical protein
MGDDFSTELSQGRHLSFSIVAFYSGKFVGSILFAENKPIEGMKNRTGISKFSIGYIFIALLLLSLFGFFHGFVLIVIYRTVSGFLIGIIPHCDQNLNTNSSTSSDRLTKIIAFGFACFVQSLLFNTSMIFASLTLSTSFLIYSNLLYYFYFQSAPEEPSEDCYHLMTDEEPVINRGNHIALYI